MGHKWYSRFLRVIRRAEFAEPLREIATSGRLTEWTRVLTDAVAATCNEMGWRAVAKGHPADFMPAVSQRLHQEYLALDVAAFTEADTRQPAEGFRWPFPALVRAVASAVLPGLSHSALAEAAPGLMLVVGTRAKAEDFPHGFFHEWMLNSQTASFRRL